MYQYMQNFTPREHQHSAFWQRSQGDCCKKCLENFSSIYHKNAFRNQTPCSRNTKQYNKFRNMLLRKRKTTTYQNILTQKQLCDLFLNSKRSLSNANLCKKLKTCHKPCKRLSKLAIPKRIRMRENYGNYRNCLSPMELDTLYNMMTDQVHKMSFECPDTMQVEVVDSVRNTRDKRRPPSFLDKSKLFTIQKDGDKIKVIEDPNRKSVKIGSKPTKCYPYDFKQRKHGSKSVYKDQETQTIEVKESKSIEHDSKKKQNTNKKQAKRIPPSSNKSSIEKPDVAQDEVINDKSTVTLANKDFAQTPCQLMSILRQCNCSTNGEIRVFDENQLPDFTLQNMLENIEEILISKTKNDKVQKVIYDKIFDYIQTASPDAWNTDMDEFVIYVSQKLANKISDSYKLSTEEVPCDGLIRSQSQAIQKVLSNVKNSANTPQNNCEIYSNKNKPKNSIENHSDNNGIVVDDSNKIHELPPWMKNIVQYLMQALETLDIEVTKIYDENKVSSLQTFDDEPKSIVQHCTCDDNPSISKLTGVSIDFNPNDCTNSNYFEPNDSTICECLIMDSDNGSKVTTTIRGGSDLKQKNQNKFMDKIHPKYKFIKRCHEIGRSTSHQATSINFIKSNESNESIINNKSFQEKILKKTDLKNETPIPDDIFDANYLVSKNICNDLIKLDNFSNATINLIKVENLIQFESTTNINNDLKQNSQIFNEMLQTKIIDYKPILTTEFSFSGIITKTSNINKTITNEIGINSTEKVDVSNSIESVKELSLLTSHTSQELCDKSLSTSSLTEDEIENSFTEEDNSLTNTDVTISSPTKYTTQLLLNDMSNRMIRKTFSKIVTNSDESLHDKCKKCKRKKVKKTNKTDSKEKDIEEKEKSDLSIHKEDKNGTSSIIEFDDIKSNRSKKPRTTPNKQFDEELKLIDDIQNAIEQIKLKGKRLLSNTTTKTNMSDDAKSSEFTNILFERTDFLIEIRNNEQIDKKCEIELYPHGHGVVCLESIKSWVLFIREVTNHATQWSCWVNRSLKKILFISSIIKGSAVDTNDNTVQYNCNIYNDFLTNLQMEIDKWHIYNKNLEDSIKIILSCCQKKVLTNCNICTDSSIKYQLLLTNDQLFYQLSEGFKTIELWRNWLNATVLELSNGTLFINDNIHV